MQRGDIQDVMNILAVLSESEKTVGEFYRLCSLVFKEDGVFWASLAGQEERHSQHLLRMTDIIVLNFNKFKFNPSFNVVAVQLFIKGVKGNIESLRSGKLKRDNVLFITRGIEDSIIESKLTEVVKTDDIEYNTLANEIMLETHLHRGRVNDKINEVKKALKSNYVPEGSVRIVIDAKNTLPQKNKEDEFAKIDPAIRIIRYHHQVSEYTEFLKRIPNKIGDAKVWSDLVKLEHFINEDIREHFKLEDELIFPEVLSKNIPAEIKELIGRLIAEHEDLLRLADKFENLVSGAVYPVSKEMVVVLNQLIVNFLGKFQNHVSEEELKVFPLFK